MGCLYNVMGGGYYLVLFVHFTTIPDLHASLTYNFEPEFPISVKFNERVVTLSRLW